MNRYQLSNWREPRDVEVINTMTRQPAGFTTHCYGGWTWTHEGREYRTDSEGCGLWIRTNSGDWRQSAGTGQFSLPNDRAKALAILRREGLTPDSIA